ncbi:MAG TPA: acetyl-CoA carboxylase biotin carboxyl carrier protein subunit [Candidatus Aminicenantes bacterium]|nr:acetyl-CoA carboxylase biotin carboxyl carrier protein subunit [Candidatus Aminicenantes bacterium]
MSEYIFQINAKEYRAEILDLSGEAAQVSVNGQEYRVELKTIGAARANSIEVRRAALKAAPAAAPAAAAVPVSLPSSGQQSNVVKTPLPGLVSEIKVAVGDRVALGQTVVVMEAMKMENQIVATCDGTIRKVFVQKGANVAEGEPLVEIERSAMSNL